jgi:hypothetical protein
MNTGLFCAWAYDMLYRWWRSLGLFPSKYLIFDVNFGVKCAFFGCFSQKMRQKTHFLRRF